MSAKHDPTSPTDRLHSQGCGKCLFCLRILAKCECTAEDKVRCSYIKTVQIMNITLQLNLSTGHTLSEYQLNTKNISVS